jgi:hypothetical protein
MSVLSLNPAEDALYDSTNLLQDFESRSLDKLKQQLQKSADALPPFFKSFRSDEKENFDCSEIDRVFSLFEEGDLIVRGMPFYFLFKDLDFTGRLSFQEWDAELEKMRGFDELINLSSTLIQKDCFVSTYTNSGFIFDANSARIQKIYSGDANTSITNEGEISGSFELELETLEDLKELIKTNSSSSSHTMNELKIKASLKDLVGLFYVKDREASPLLCVQTLMWKKHIYEKFGVDLPIFEYHFSGKLNYFNPTKDEIRALCRKIQVVSKQASLFFAKELC